jgi:hypothetical protein
MAREAIERQGDLTCRYANSKGTEKIKARDKGLCQVNIVRSERDDGRPVFPLLSNLSGNLPPKKETQKKTSLLLWKPLYAPSSRHGIFSF